MVSKPCMVSWVYAHGVNDHILSTNLKAPLGSAMSNLRTYAFYALARSSLLSAGGCLLTSCAQSLRANLQVKMLAGVYSSCSIWIISFSASLSICKRSDNITEVWSCSDCQTRNDSLMTHRSRLTSATNADTQNQGQQHHTCRIAVGKEHQVQLGSALCRSRSRTCAVGCGAWITQAAGCTKNVKPISAKWCSCRDLLRKKPRKRSS